MLRMTAQLLVLLAGSLLLTACLPTPASEQVSTPTRPVSETPSPPSATVPTGTTPAGATPASGTATPLASATPPPPPTLTPVVADEDDEALHFVFHREESAADAVSVIMRRPDGWARVDLPLPRPVDTGGDRDYAPTSHRLLFIPFSLTGGGPSELAVGPLNLLDMTSGDIEPLADHVLRARWTPDGLGLAYIQATDETYELRFRDAAGADRLLARHVPRTFSFSPDGRMIAFTRESGYRPATPPGIFVINLETGLERLLSELDGAGSGSYRDEPQWSPEGESLVHYVNPPARDPDVSPYELAGFAWLAADGAFAHLIRAVDLDAALPVPDGAAETRWCRWGPALYATDQLVQAAAGCGAGMGDVPPLQHLALFQLDRATGAVGPVRLLGLGEPANLITWARPGQSVLIQSDAGTLQEVLLEASSSP